MKLAERISKIEPSITIEISDLAKKLKSEGRDILSFAAGEPDFDTPQIIKDEAIKAIQDGFTKYTAVDGMIELKRAIITKLKTYNDIEYEEDEIIVSSGAKHSLFNVFSSLIDHGDEVIIPAPYWVSYPEVVRYCGGKDIILKTKFEDNFKINPDDLQKLITPKTKMIILTTPSNPTGIVYSKDELEKISNILKETNIWVLSDEIYDRLVFDNCKFTSVGSLNEDMKQRTITINGASKSASMTGWRIGFMASKNKELVKSCKKLQSQNASNPNSIAQKASIKLFDGSVEKDIEYMRSEFEKRRNLAFDKLSEIKGIKLNKPEGAFYLFINIEDINPNCLEFCKDLLSNEGVALVPGIAFGMSGYFRMSYATSEKNIIDGISRIKRFIESL